MTDESQSLRTEDQQTYGCGTCGAPIKTGCYCSDECAPAGDLCGACGYEPCRCDEEFDPYEAAGESRFGLPGGGNSL